ncbi:MAG TPA: anhydro-N-acetylmuramic acid kinase [Pseudomonadales bacterium]|nr:anhydro-N-acetylmuramic acid kinase [Pseudomonadales bacterium]
MSTEERSDGDCYLGVMSGTSLDAVDVGLFRFTDTSCLLLAKHSLPIPADIRQEAIALATPGPDELNRLHRLDIDHAELIATAVNQLLAQCGIDRARIRAIGSHGQTLRHSPGGDHAFTCQVGDPNRIAYLTGLVTVADFRRKDMVAGGEGAPLAPAFHHWLFSHPTEYRMVLNLGGIANLTVLPPTQHPAAVVGFDTGPGNALLDGWCQRHLGQPYDHRGNWSRSGSCHEPLLRALLDDAFFQATPPKSTGRERFNLNWLSQRLRDFAHCAPVDVQATLLELTARSVAQAIDRWGCGTELYLCGGGVENRALVDRLQAALPGRRIHSTELLGLPPQWVEAATFAWLARQRLLGRPGNLPSVTGARRPVMLGGVYLPDD